MLRRRLLVVNQVKSEQLQYVKEGAITPDIIRPSSITSYYVHCVCAMCAMCAMSTTTRQFYACMYAILKKTFCTLAALLKISALTYHGMKH